MAVNAKVHASTLLYGAEDKIVNTKQFRVFEGLYSKGDAKIEYSLYIFNGEIEIQGNPDSIVELIEGKNELEYRVNELGTITWGYRYITYVTNNPPTLSIKNQTLGEISSFDNINYTITESDNEKFTLTEKLDNEIIRTLENQISGTSYTLSLNDRWQNISYGNHTIEIIATDVRGGTSKVTITFRKIKSPITTLPTTASLKQAIVHNKEIESELIFQLWKFKDTLNSKGITTTETDSISILIDKIKGLPSIAMYEEVKLNSEKIKELEDINAENVNKISILEGQVDNQTTLIANIQNDQLNQDDSIMQGMMGTAEVCEMVIMLQEQIDAMQSTSPVTLNLNNKLGGDSAMVEVYANLVLAGKYTCSPNEAVNGVKLVPSVYREQVKTKLNEWAK